MINNMLKIEYFDSHLQGGKSLCWQTC